MSQVTNPPVSRQRRSADDGHQDAPPAPAQRNGKPRRRPRPKWPVVVGLGAVAALAAIGGIVLKTIHNIVPESGHGSIGQIWSDMANPAAEFPGKDRVNVLLIGKDYDRDSKGMPSTKHSRSDSIVILSLDLKKATISALSVPRDTHVVAPDGHSGKINGTYARGGAPLLLATLTNLLGMTPDYYVSLKPDGLKEMVDSLGGVDVVAIDDMNYDDNWGQLHVHLKKGAQHIDGDQAIGFTRFREVKPGTPHSKEEGDPRRMARQQMVIRAMATEAKQPQNWLHLDKIINLGLSQVDTSLSHDQVFALAALFRNVQPDQIESAALIGHGTPRGGGPYYFYPDPKKTAAMVDWLLKGDESAANRLTEVAVENGTPVPGLARRVADVLREQGGFDATSRGTAPVSTVGEAAPTGGVQETEIMYTRAAVEPRAERIAQLLGGGKVEKTAAPIRSPRAAGADVDGPDVTVVLGSDLAANFAVKSAGL